QLVQSGRPLRLTFAPQFDLNEHQTWEANPEAQTKISRTESPLSDAAVRPAQRLTMTLRSCRPIRRLAAGTAHTSRWKARPASSQWNVNCNADPRVSSTGWVR